VLQRHNLDAPEGEAFARGTRDWWRSLPLPMAEQLRVRQDLALLDVLDSLEASVEQHLGRLSMTARLLAAGPVSAPIAWPAHGSVR
jgi:hypothetical protein